jgi:hypothetical protein
MEETGIDYMGRMYMDLQGKYRESVGWMGGGIQ